MNSTTFYWGKIFVIVAITTAIVLVIIFGVQRGVPGTAIAGIVAPLVLAVSQMLPGVSNAKTTIAPPPMPPADPTPPPWSEVYIPVKPVPPAPDTSPVAPEAKP